MGGRAGKAGRTRGTRARLCAVLAGGALLTLGGCASSDLSPRVASAARAGAYGPAAALVQQNLPQDRSDRDYLLTRMRLVQLLVDEGQPSAAEEASNQLFDLLRTQGLNADNTVASVVLSENVRVWKGEPFEQAYAYALLAMQRAMLGEWDNARAAATGSLFLLRDFSQAIGRPEPTTLDLAREAARRDGTDGEGPDFLDNGYVTTQSDFALGYLLAGVSARALGRADEASDNFAAAARANPALEDLSRELREGSYDLVLVVQTGLGPRKVATGPDNVVAEYMPRTRSDDAPALVTLVAGEGAGGALLAEVSAPVVQDLNAMARSHRWRNLEDVRRVKSALGDALMLGGVVVAASSRDQGAQLAGLGAALLGAMLKATSAPDLRHAELIPQRVYVIPLRVGDGPATARVRVAEGEIVLTNVRGASGRGAEGSVLLRVVRVPERGGAWTTSGSERYAHAQSPARIPGDDMPFIFGGRCVSIPSERVMRRYHDAGNLEGLTQVDLENLYRAEGITFSIEDQRGMFGTHVLEGGTSLVAPLAGTSGYQRLFGQDHPPYQPRSDELRAAREREGGALEQPAQGERPGPGG